MREIKLRFIIKDQRDDTLRTEDLLLEEYGKGLPYLSEYEIVHDRLQFTGLLDKNGKEIYKGDILTSLYKFDGCEGLYEVCWFNEGGKFYPKKHGKHQQTGVTITMSDLTRCEVIGNIFKNPELINHPLT